MAIESAPHTSDFNLNVWFAHLRDELNNIDDSSATLDRLIAIVADSPTYVDFRTNMADAPPSERDNTTALQIPPLTKDPQMNEWTGRMGAAINRFIDEGSTFTRVQVIVAASPTYAELIVNATNEGTSDEVPRR